MSASEGAHPTPIRVVAAVVRREGRYLVGRRPEAKRHGGLWEFPGGKVAEGESHLDAVGRELSEELSIEATATGRLLYAVGDPGSPYVIEFLETTVSGEPRAIEHTEIGWFTPDELRALPLAPADARFVESLARA